MYGGVDKGVSTQYNQPDKTRILLPYRNTLNHSYTKPHITEPVHRGSPFCMSCASADAYRPQVTSSIPTVTGPGTSKILLPTSICRLMSTASRTSLPLSRTV